MEINIKNTSSVHNDGIKILIHGNSSIGKTTQLGTLEGKTLILSAESGLLVLKNKNVDFVDISSIDDLANVYTMLKNGELQYDNICLDSLSEIGDMMVTELEADDYYGDPTNAFPKWSEYSKRMTKIVKLFRDLKGFNVIFTALTEAVENNGSIKYLPMIPAKKFQSKLVSIFDEVYYYSINKDGDRVLHTASTSTFDAKSRAGLDSQIVVSDDINLGSILKTIQGK